MQDKELVKEYVEFKEEVSKEISNFISENMVFAFSKEQHERVLEELGMTDEEFQNEYTGYMGGAIKKNKFKELKEIAERLYSKVRDKIFNSYDFAKGAFYYEMGNYEVVYSHDYEEVFSALEVTEEEVNNNDLLKRAFQDAKVKYFEDTDG